MTIESCTGSTWDAGSGEPTHRVGCRPAWVQVPPSVRTVLLSFLTLLAVVLLHPRPAYAGYTHYWTWHARPDADALRACVADMSRVVETRRGSLADRQDRPGAAAVFVGSRTFADAGDPGPDIVFNGIGDDGHEQFGFPLAPFTGDHPEFQFVKTAAKPYDEVVTACLIVARDHFRPEVLTIASDGTWPDWAAGAALYEQVFGRTAKNPLGGELDGCGSQRDGSLIAGTESPT